MAVAPLILLGATAAASTYQQVRAGQAANATAALNAKIEEHNARRQQQQAELAAQQEEANAAAADQDAAFLDDLLTYELRRLERGADYRSGALHAQFAASGVEMTGSPRDLMDEDERQSGIEASLLRFRTASEQRALRAEAQQSRFAANEARRTGAFVMQAGQNRARIQRMAGREAFVSSLLGGASTLGGAATQITARGLGPQARSLEDVR